MPPPAVADVTLDQLTLALAAALTPRLHAVATASAAGTPTRTTADRLTMRRYLVNIALLRDLALGWRASHFPVPEPKRPPGRNVRRAWRHSDRDVKNL